MKAEELTIEAIEDRVGVPVHQWHGQCFGIALAAAELLGEGAVAVYGHYLGNIDQEGYWGNKAPHIGFVQHGWVALRDGRVLDPTRWSFLNTDPFIYVGDGGNEYDEGGNHWRAACQSPPPKWEWPTDTVAFKDITSEEDARFQKIACLIGVDNIRFGNHLALTMAQVFWIANVPYGELQPVAGPIYRAIAHAVPYGEDIVPIDNWRRAERERDSA